MDKSEIEKLIDMKMKKDFQKKIGDTPTDAFQLVNRKYANLNGTTANRPIGSVATTGQQYFDTTTGYPIFWNGTNWVSATGSVVGS